MEVKNSYENSDELDSIIEVLKKTLAPLAEQRCSSIAEVCSLLAPAVESAFDCDAKAENAAESQGRPEDAPTEDGQQREDQTENDEESTQPILPILPIQFEPLCTNISSP